MPEHNTYHMIDSANQNLYEPSRRHNYELIVTGVEELLRAGARVTVENAQEDDYVLSGSDSLRLSVINVTLPHFEQEEIEVRRGNTRVYYAGVPQFSEGTFEFNDHIGLEVVEVLKAWQRLSFDVTTGKIGRARDYKKSHTLIEYAPDWTPIRKWRVDGLWIKNLTEDPLSNEDSGKRTISATFRYDRAIPLRADE